MDLVCQDTQLNISAAYLKPGFAFGGSCLPKDLRATAHLARMRDVDLPMHSAILQSNREHIDRALAKVLASGRRKVGMLGLSFKTGTDDLRESPLVMLAEQLIGKGIRLEIHDPDVQLSRLLGANRSFIETQLPHIGELLSADLAGVIERSDLIIVGLSSARILDALVLHVRSEQIVLDLVRLPNATALRAPVEGLCW
jgi:GDP-mannose 6-dehydrogenase